MWHTPVECVSFIPYNGTIIINVLHKSYKDTKQYTLKIKNDQWYKSGGLSIMTYLVSDYVT